MGLFSKEFKLAVNLHKTYFDTGLALTSYIKIFVLILGIGDFTISKTIYLAVGYAFLCYVLGYLWLRSGFYEASLEISNLFNPFVKEMRDTVIKKKP